MHDVHTHRFENGLTLHVAAGHRAPVAAVQAWVGAGSADEAAHAAGVAHVVEHMLFKGSAGYGLGELVRTIERAGGEINAWTAFDHTVYHAVLAADHVDAAIHALGDALLDPLVDPGELAREREVILEEIRQGSDDPARSVAQSLFATAYVAHPYRRPVIGTADSVGRIGERELVEFFRSYYVADNTTLVVAGDVDPERVRRSVERRFRAMPSGRPVRSAATEPPQTAPRASCVHREVGEAHLAIGFHVPAIRHPDVAALDVATILLGQSESARLPRMLRERERLTSASASLHALRDPGLLVVSATARPGHTPSTIAALIDGSAALAGDIAPGELDKARITVEAAFVRQLETAQGRARSLGWHATVAGDPQFGHVHLDRIRAVRRNDIADVMRRYLRPDNASVAAILPARSKQRRTAWARQAERRVGSALAAAAPAAAAPVPAIEQRVVLASGLTLLVRRDPAVPIVAMRAVWRGGQRIEDAEHAGASTLLARMVTRGCGKRDAQATADRIDRLGGALSGVAGRNSFGVAAEWLAASWRPGLDLLADCVLEPQLASGELVRERRLLLDEQTAQGASPSQAAFRLFSEALYGAHPYARDVLGSPDAVGAMSRAALAAFYRERYPVSAMTLAIVGDVELDEVIAAVEQRFGRVRRTAAPPPPAVPVIPDGRSAADREVYRYLDRAQAHLVIGFPGATVDAPDRFALEVLVAILGGQSGRLFAELRDRQALTYRVSAHSIEGLDPGFVAIYLSCAPDKLSAAVAAVRDQLARLRSDGVTAAEVERARSYLIGSHQIAMQRRAAVASALAYHEAYGLGWQSWTGYEAAIRAVTPAQVAAAAAAYLRDDRAITATVRPPAATPGAIRRSRLPNALPLPPAKHPPPRSRDNV